MPRRQRHYSPFNTPNLSMSELVKTTLDHDSTDVLIDNWLKHRHPEHDPHQNWFEDVRDREYSLSHSKQIIAWNKGDFVPEYIFCRTVDTGRLIPLDRTWTTHVYHHKSMQRQRSMLPVVFTMLPELMLLRGMHDTGCDEIYIIVTDMRRQDMDDATEYFKLVCRYAYGRHCKPSIAKRIQYEHMRLCHTLLRHHRTPCFPQIDLTLRAILHEKHPRFLILFSHHPTSYSQIFFTHRSYVPDEEIFYDYPTGCQNPCCNEDCEMIRFPRKGLESAAVLNVKRKGKRKVKPKQMCNWIDCDVVFCDEEEEVRKRDSPLSENSSSEGSESGSGGDNRPVGQTCGKCKLVRYCSAEHQRRDWEEHRRVCVKPP